MSVEVFTIEPTEVRGLLPDFPAELDEYAARSKPLLVGLYNGSPACVAGLCPITCLSDAAYIWGWSGPLVSAHRLIYVRWSHKVVAKALTHYPILVGHCEHFKAKWLISLGARLYPISPTMSTFVIEAPR